MRERLGDFLARAVWVLRGCPRLPAVGQLSRAAKLRAGRLGQLNSSASLQFLYEMFTDKCRDLKVDLGCNSINSTTKIE